ncbi:uncharacterized protein [Agelaius tricolor]|uniref:uncharacterized protein n=1 Tax=Agelaius tricolor TaxID=9191 RepID=UPI0039F243AE
MDLLEQVQIRGTRMIRGMEHLCCEERLRELASFSLERLQGDVIVAYQYVKGEYKKNGERLLQEHTHRQDRQTEAQVRGGAGDPDTRTPGAPPRRLAGAHGLCPRVPLRPPARAAQAPARRLHNAARRSPLPSLPPVPAPGTERGRPRPRAQGGAGRQGSGCGPRVCLPPPSLPACLPSPRPRATPCTSLPPWVRRAAPCRGGEGARSATTHLLPRPRHTFPGAPPLPPALPGRACACVCACCVSVGLHIAAPPPARTDGRTEGPTQPPPPARLLLLLPPPPPPQRRPLSLSPSLLLSPRTSLGVPGTAPPPPPPLPFPSRERVTGESRATNPPPPRGQQTARAGPGRAPGPRRPLAARPQGDRRPAAAHVTAGRGGAGRGARPRAPPQEHGRAAAGAGRWRPLAARRARRKHGGRGLGTGTGAEAAPGNAVPGTGECRARHSPEPRARGPPCSQDAGAEGPSAVVAVLAPAASTFWPRRREPGHRPALTLSGLGPPGRTGADSGSGLATLAVEGLASTGEGPACSTRKLDKGITPTGCSHSHVFPRAMLACQLHTNARANRVPIFCRSTEEEENLACAIACCFAGLQVVMFKGQSTSNCLALPEPSCHLHPFPERVHEVQLTTSCCSLLYHGTHRPAAAVSSSRDRQINN